MLSPTNTPSPTDEDRELIDKLRQGGRADRSGYRYDNLPINPDGPAAAVAVANELVNGGGLQLRSGNVPRLTVVETSDKSDPHYRLCTLLDALNRSTDRAT